MARRVTDEKNFDLQALVYGEDEVGILAQSLNQLIHQVNHLFTQLGQKNRELETALQQLNQQQMQLVQTEKMSSLGQLVAGVAHEINNPVNFIHGNLKHVKDYVDEVIDVIEVVRQRHPDAIAEIEADSEDLDLDFLQADLGKMLDSMQVGTERIRQIVLSLRSFSRLDEAAYKPADIHDGIESSLMILQHRLKAKPNRPTITITRDYGDLPQVDCFPGQLNQVVMNILANAIDAIDERYANSGDARSQVPLEITLRTRCVENGQVEIAIADTGIGMDAETRDRIFEPFYTTKPVGVGTGLGMSISHQIVTEIHGGQLECKSEPGEGTEFIIRIPIHQIQDEAEVTAAIATTST
ncbi:MAG: HAMP domain-containing histidine kinase [Leptolyngbyaceae cyanobacterium T60_A2020_046]|nr:HAMP domain-containing histidine kinase [Leptolyngbyaceae cyanobacterium T60_A2020_046]